MPKNFLRSNEIDMGEYSFEVDGGESVYDRLHNNYRIRHSARRIAREQEELKTSEERELEVHCTFTPNITHDAYIDIPYVADKEGLAEAADADSNTDLRNGHGPHDNDDDFGQKIQVEGDRRRRAAERMPWEPAGASYFGGHGDVASSQAHASRSLAGIPRHAEARSTKRGGAPSPGKSSGKAKAKSKGLESPVRLSKSIKENFFCTTFYVLLTLFGTGFANQGGPRL